MSSGSELDLMQSMDFDDGSNNDLTVSSHLEFRDGTKPLITKTGSGHMSPVRARTMKEYDQQLAELQKENFSLKLRIYFLEERMKNQSDDDAEGVFKQNIELKVEAESLKRDLIDKQELLKKASSALTSVTSHHQMELQQTRDAGIAEGQQMARSELEAVKLCIEGLRKELNTKNEEVENLLIQSKETETKLSDLLTINRQLDSRWRQLERERNSLEMRLEMLSSVELTSADQEENPESPHKGVTDEVIRKDRLIEQLRCALKAKDVIIEQVEEEKKETIKETTTQLQKKILELEARVEQEAPEDILLTVESLKDGGRLKSAAGVTEGEATQAQREGKVIRKPVLLDAEVQTTVASAQTKDLEHLQVALSAKEEELSALNLSLSQHQMENERLKKQIGRRDREVVQLMDQLEKADESLKKQDGQMKELRNSLQEERHKNTDKMLELDVQYKALLDDGQQHLANQNETIHRLTRSLRQKDEQLEKMLELSSLADASKATKVAEILRDLQKKNEEAIEDLIAENSLNVKSKNEEIDHLKKSLHQQTDDYARTHKELAVCRQMIADMETKARLTDHTLQQMTNALRDQQAELKETKDHHGSDISGREKLIQQLMASLPNKDKPLQTSHGPFASDAALVSVHSGSAEANDLLSDLQNQLKVKEDQLQVAETRLHNLTVEMNYLRETLLKYRYSESSLVNPELGKRAVKAKDRGRVREAQDNDSVRVSKDSGNLSSSDSEPLSSFPEKLLVHEIDRNERFQIYETPSRMTLESSNVHGCYEDKSQQTDKVSTADEDEINRLQAEIKHLKMLVNRTVTTDSRGNSLTSTPKEEEGRSISTSGAGRTSNQMTSPADDVDAGAMDVEGHNHSGRVSSQEKRKAQARRHLTLSQAEMSTSQDVQTDDTLLNEFSGAGSSPNPNSSFFGRESRTTPPRSNISYLSVESSKRWSPEDALAAEHSGLEGDGVGQMMSSFIGALSSFQTLLPDDSTLSEMSNAELKDIICNMKQKVSNQCKTLPQGTSLSHVSTSDALSSHSRLVSPLGNVSSHSRPEYNSTKLRQLEEKLTEKDKEISGLNLHLEKLRTELSKSGQTIQALEKESRSHKRKSQDSATLVLESELNRLREELKSSERAVDILKEKVENQSQRDQHKSQDSAMQVLESELNCLREELESSERTVHLLKEQMERESQNHQRRVKEQMEKESESQQRKSHDSTTLVLESELNHLREELKSSETTVHLLKEQLERESRNRQRESHDSAMLVLESELSRLREELESSERTVQLLKEQIELNTQVGKSTVGFNPELIVRMAKEIDKMKKDIAKKNEGFYNTQPKGLNLSGDSYTSKSHLRTQKIDRATSTENLTAVDNGLHATPSGKTLLDHSKMQDLNDTRQKEGRNIVVSGGRQGIDKAIVELQSTGLDDLADAGNQILNKSSSGSLDGRMFPGEKKSQIPVLKKSSRSPSLDSESIESEPRKCQIPVLARSSRSLSLDGEGSITESDAVKCTQLETRILMLEATIASQSKQLSDYQSRLKEHQRNSLENQSGSVTPTSLHTTPLPSKGVSIRDQELQMNDGSTATDGHRLRSGSKSSDVADGSLGLDEVVCELPSGDHDMTSDFLHPGCGVLTTPFNDTKAANDRAFVQLKNEVQTLKAQLDMYKRENSRLNDTIQMYSEQSLWLPAASPFGHDASSRSRGTSASADDFLRHRMELMRHEGELQCHLEESHRNCDLLRTHLEELLLFMEDLLPLIDTANTPMRLASLRGKLNETRSLLADVSQSFNSTYDGSSLRMSLTGSYLSRLDLDSNLTARIEEEDRSFCRSSRSLIHSVNSKDATLSERTSDAELGRQQLQMEVFSLDRNSRELQEHLRQKELELASVATEAANSKSQLAELLDEMEMLRTSLRGEQERTSLMKTELVDLKKELELASMATEAANSKSQLAELLDEIEMLRTSLQGEEERKSLMKMELVDLKQDYESLAKTLEDTRQKLKDLGSQRDSLDKMNHHLEATLAGSNAKVVNLEQELVDCEARRVKELHQVEEGQLRRLATFEQEHSLLMSKIELLTAEVQELRIEIVRERDRSAAAEVGRKSCVEQLQDKDSIIRKLKELVKENQTTAEDLGNQLHRLNADIQEKKLTIQKLNKKCEDLQNSLHQSHISSSSLPYSGSRSKEMASVPSTNQGFNSQSLKGSKVASSSEGFSSARESFRPPPGGSSKGEWSVSSDHRESDVLSSKVADSSDHHHPGRILSPTKDYLDQKPTRDTSDSISSGHLAVLRLSDPGIFQGGRIPSAISTSVSHDRSAGAGSLELQLIAAQDTIRLLQMELKIFKQRKRSVDAKGEERMDELEEEETLEEAMEEIRQLRLQLEQSVQKNDQLRDVLMQQAKLTDGGDVLHAAQFGPLSNSREKVTMLQSTRELDMAQREISMHKARISRLQSDLSQKATEAEAIEIEKNHMQRSLSAMKMKLENALAETRRLKEALDESNELNRTMKLELRLQEMMTKADNKENERGLSLSPSRRSSSGSPTRLQLSDLMTEIRQLRIQMERTIENNNILRQRLEEVSRNSVPSRSEAAKILKATEKTIEGSVGDGLYGSQSPKAASLVPHVSRHVAVEGKKRDSMAGSVPHPSSADQLVFVVADPEVYERLKEEVSLNQVAIGKLEESIQTIHSQVIEDDRKKDLSEVIQKMRTIANEQTQLIALFWFLNLLKPDKNTTDTARVVENELLRKQLADLRQRYARAKHAMKGAQERLEANNRKKEEFFTMQKNKKEQAILEQISKTHQVLAQARQNLEAVHHQTNN